MARHVEDSVEAVAKLHREHYGSATGLQRSIDKVTERLGRPATPLVVMAVVIGWATYASLRGGGGVDQPAFAWLELAATVAAFLVSILILVTQRREDQLADRRAQLTLELALLADRKSAKIIQLLEELRRDQPDVTDRVDTESDDMSKPTDPEAVAASIADKSGDERS
ncbi:DUF1003 domain-containing protein [Caulobacter hibisci]|uniref:DUF1003 domain-containing protein n=1 Tax=Caulobacter hibisci TaxID=2035993 RepID=A0ABS0SX48_9CAUL|nr:DUF1003 domain-containing protein [Caulobacter hibisci]MBI1684173.1 DUF1003 domain-containing protein [Caulobacter hibisci]